MLLRPAFGPRIGRPGLIGTAARTAVIAGTGAMTINAVNRRSQRKALEQQEAEAFEQGLQETRRQPPTTAAESAADPMIAKLKELAALHQSGVLTDDEFTQAKARLLA
jgi:hypothetical protein